jgi:Protein of unknown function (DUF2934)
VTLKEFISVVFLHESKRLIDSRFHYISFAVIGLGIEFLGACLDAHPFDKKGQSGPRFKLAIETLFPSPYKLRRDDLCNYLRNGFAHQFRPGKPFVVTQREESIQEGTRHFGPYGSQTVLVAEDLYADFAEACREVIRRIDDGRLSHQKLSGAFLNVTTPPTGTAAFDKGDRIRVRSYELYKARGGQHGHALDDWLQAEKEVG